MVIDTSKECSSRVLANVLAKEMATTRMLIHERRDVVNESGNKDEWAGLGLFLDCKIGQ
jgi:hypothetical protein